MKQKDLALFIVIGTVSLIFSVLISNYLITPSKGKVQKAEKVEAIVAEFPTPASDSAYFNKDSINPTKLIIIGDSPNDKPFSNGN
jgi:hypothetical protein